MGEDGGCRVGEVQAGTTSPMPNHKGFMLQELSEIHPLTPAVQGFLASLGGNQLEKFDWLSS